MKSLYARLLAGFVAANLLVLVASVFLTDRIGRLVAGDEPDLDAIAAEVASAYRERGGEGAAATARSLRRTRGVDAFVFEDGRSLLLRPPPPPIRRNLPQLLAAQRLVLREGDGDWMAGVALPAPPGRSLHLVVGRGPRPPHASRGVLLTVQLALSVLVIAGLGLVMARSLTAPIRAVQAATRRMAAGDLSARAAASAAARGDELGALARDFNDMAERTERLVQQQRTVLQDVSHELRSPLARLHLLLELARSGATDDGSRQLDRAATEVGRLDALIGEVLNLARLEATLPGLVTAPIGVAALLAEVVAEHALDAEARRINVQLDAAEGLIVRGDATLLARAIGNGLANALKFSPGGSTVQLTAQALDAHIAITVRDEGPGVPAAQLAALFAPFYRGSNATRAEGHGLGLAITQRIVRAHGGELSAANAPGGGLALTIRLPRAA
jgi:signal transduction histidine kinase